MSERSRDHVQTHWKRFRQEHTYLLGKSTPDIELLFAPSLVFARFLLRMLWQCDTSWIPHELAASSVPRCAFCYSIVHQDPVLVEDRPEVNESL